jgi:putative acetyltransferase
MAARPTKSGNIPASDPDLLSDTGIEIHANMRSSRSVDVRIEELTQVTAEEELRSARDLLLEYGRFVLAQPGAGRFCFGTLQQEADGLPESFVKQGGGSLLALVDGEPAGFVAWRVPAAKAAVLGQSWELKRLWVRSAHRGLGLGRMLTQAVLDRAIAAGRKAVYLDTAPESMAYAYRLYQDMGFRNCDPYNENSIDGLTWMVKSL